MAYFMLIFVLYLFPTIVTAPKIVIHQIDITIIRLKNIQLQFT